jgi:hypothetical protein
MILMTSAEFRDLLRDDREAAIGEYIQAWVDANNESTDDLVSSLVSLTTYAGTPRLVLSDNDDDIAADYDEMVGNDDEESDDAHVRGQT